MRRNKEHLQIFRNTISKREFPEFAYAKNARKFAEPFLRKDQLLLLENRGLTRYEVLDLVCNQDVETGTVCSAILSWGGMRYQHRNLFFETQYLWIKIADEIRSGSLNRIEAYRKFHKLIKQGKIRGIGPSFYTKLIYFLMHNKSGDNAPGYIMDKWASLSINLLFDKKIVLMNSSRLVRKENSVDNYDEFCRAMDILRKSECLNEHEVDLAVFSSGGRVKGPWRDYVIRCYSNRIKV